MEVDGVLVQAFIFMNVVPGVDQDVSANLHSYQDLKKVKVSSAWLHILILAYHSELMTLMYNVRPRDYNILETMPTQ